MSFSSDIHVCQYLSSGTAVKFHQIILLFLYNHHIKRYYNLFFHRIFKHVVQHNPQRCCTHVKTHNFLLATSLKQACQQVCSNAVILSSCTKFVTHNLLTSCWNKLVTRLLRSSIKLVASLLQACSNLINKLGTTSASTSS